MVFLPGEHEFNKKIHIRYIETFSMVAETEGTSVIVCSGSDCGGFYFENVKQLILVGLKFVSESHSITVVDVNDFQLTNSTFSDNCNTSLVGMYSNLFLEGNTFTNNSGQGQEQEHFSPGGGISISESNMTLQGENHFQNNTCFGDQCGGSAIYANDCPLIMFSGNTTVVNNSVMDGRDTDVPSGGGGFLFLSSTIEIPGHVTFINNTVSNLFVKVNSYEICGAGASFIMCNTTISGEVIFSNNVAVGLSGCGGGLFLFIGSVTVSGGVRFHDNYAGFQGGGIFQKKVSMNIFGTMTFSNNSAVDSGGGVKLTYGSVNISGDVVFSGNYAGPSYKGTVSEGGGLDMWYSNLTVTGSMLFANNSAYQAGGIAIVYSMMLSSGNVTIINNAANPKIGSSGGGLLIGGSNATISNALIANNTASQGGGMMVQSGNMVLTERVLFMQNTGGFYGGGATLIDSTLNNSGNLEFVQNSAVVSGGGILLKTSNITVTVTGRLFLNENSAASADNSNGGGMALHLYSVVTVYGNMSLTNNSAIHSGGGIILYDGTCTLVINGRIYFTGNKAGVLGGAIFATDINPFVYCLSKYDGAVAELVKDDCFFKTLPAYQNKSLMVFEGNKAQSGDVLFGGAIDACRLEGQPGADSGSVFNAISNFSKQPKTQSVFSSFPYQVCICEEEHLLCGEVDPITAFPGETFSFKAVTVGQRNGTVNMSIIFADVTVLDLEHDMVRLGVYEDSQIVYGCTNVKYTLFSKVSVFPLLDLYVYGSCSSLAMGGSMNRLHIQINLLDCPRGFMWSNTSFGCICEKRLQKYTNSCNINGQIILRDRDYWVGFDNESDSQGLILNPHCPLDYCKSKAVNFTLNEIDLQCNNNRTGLLCGACKPGLSLVIGSTKCLPCANTYLTLLIAFGLMGLVLLLFFLVFNAMIVSPGVISGLIFYSSIIGANQKIFFQHGMNIMAIFVMWLKLDLGIETCFYDGMDAYAKTWLEFVFPIYIFCLISLLIMLRKCFPSIAKRVYFSQRSRPEAVLATFFILSYGKIVQNVVSVFSYTTLLYPNNVVEVVWTYDANIKFLQGKHIPLFVVSLLFTIIVILPFTLLLLFGHLLKEQLKRLLCSSISSPLIQVLNIFHKPYVKKHRYWPGLILFIRLVLFLIFNINALRDSGENLLAISAASFGLLTWPWIVGQVYQPKYKWSGILEATYILNLGVFTCATFYVQQSGGNQAAVAYASTGVAFASFIATLFYHIYIQKNNIRKLLKLWYKCLSPQSRQNNEEETGSLIETSKSSNQETYQSIHTHDSVES